MALEFPNWIRPVTNKGYSLRHTGENIVYTTVAGGISRASLNYVSEKVPFSVAFVIDNGVDYQGFIDWYFNRSNQGTSKFEMQLDSGNGIETHICIIVPGTYNVSGDFPWNVNFTVEAEGVSRPFDGSLFDLMQGGYTNIEPLLDRLAIFANEDVKVL